VFSSRRRHTRFSRDWSSDVCSSDLAEAQKVDRPSFHILHNEQLVNAAAKFDRGEQVEIRSLRGSRRQRFYEAAEAGLALPEEERSEERRVGTECRSGRSPWPRRRAA